MLTNLKVWWFPPSPRQIHNQPTLPDLYFTHKLCLWMPYKMWQCRLLCVMPGCQNAHLTGAGIHRIVRLLLDIDNFYYLATENLICSKCRRVYILWSQPILKELHVGHRSQFPAILTGK